MPFPSPFGVLSRSTTGGGDTTLSLLRLLSISLCLSLFRALIAALSRALAFPPMPDTRTPRLPLVFGTLKLLLPLGVRLSEDLDAARWAPTLAMTREREIRGRRAGTARGLDTFVSEVGTCDREKVGAPLEKMEPLPLLVVKALATGGGDVRAKLGSPTCAVVVCSGTFGSALGSASMALGRNAALDNEDGLTVLCILARELAVGASSVEVLFLTMLFVLLLSTSLDRTLEGIPDFFKPIELAMDDACELPVPLELVLDLSVPPTLVRLLVRDIRLRGC